MSSKLSRNIYLCLFIVLYISVAFVSTLHAVSFFELSNTSALSIILAITFEIGQAAVLFSILTTSAERNKILPWFLMTILTIVQVLGNVYASYKYIILNSADNLRFFKEPIFMWTDLPDEHANVIITFICAGILPLVALAMTAMVTDFIGKSKQISEQKVEEKPIEDSNVELPVEQQEEKPIEDSNKENTVKSHFVNL